MVPAVAVRVVLVDPVATVTEAGTGNRVLLLESDTVAPPVRAGLFKVIAQVVAALLLKLAGVQASELTITGANRLMLAVCDVPLRVAVRVAVPLLAMVPAVAANVIEVDPAATVTEVAGTGRSVLLLVIVTAAPPVGAGLFSVTVHVVSAPEPTLVGVHANELSTVDAVRATVAVWETPAGKAAEA